MIQVKKRIESAMALPNRTGLFFIGILLYVLFRAGTQHTLVLRLPALLPCPPKDIGDPGFPVVNALTPGDESIQQPA
jgi:hypothetical protein